MKNRPLLFAASATLLAALFNVPCTAQTHAPQLARVTVTHVKPDMLNEWLDLQKNEDGSITLHFGPRAPAGKEANWVPTNNRNFEVMFRFYGPEESFFGKTWRLPDIEAETG